MKKLLEEYDKAYGDLEDFYLGYASDVLKAGDKPEYLRTLIMHAIDIATCNMVRGAMVTAVAKVLSDKFKKS